jgi:Phage integrase, N-terminal SAM-like domain
MQLRNYSENTIYSYIGAVERFARHFGRSPAQLGAEHVKQLLLFLKNEKKVAWQTDVLRRRSGVLIRFGLDETEAASAVQGTTLRGGDDRPLRPLVPAVSAQLAAIGRNHGRAKLERRSRDDLALGSAVRAGIEPALPPRTPEYESVVESRRDVLPRGRRVELFISGGGFNGYHNRLSLERHA